MAEPSDPRSAGGVVGTLRGRGARRARSAGRDLEPERQRGRGRIPGRACRRPRGLRGSLPDGFRERGCLPVRKAPRLTPGVSGTEGSRISTTSRAASRGKSTSGAHPANCRSRCRRRPGERRRSAGARLCLQAELATDHFALREADAEEAALDTNVAAYENALQLTTNRFDQGSRLRCGRGPGPDSAFGHARAGDGRRAVPRAARARDRRFAGRRPPICRSRARALAGAAARAGRPALGARRAAARTSPRPRAGRGRQRASGWPRRPSSRRLGLTASGGYGARCSPGSSSRTALVDRRVARGDALSGGKRRAAKEQAVAAYDASVAAYRQSVLTAFQEVGDQLGRCACSARRRKTRTTRSRRRSGR